MAYLLDTNIVSLALRNNFKVTAEIAQLKSQRQILSISCVTYFEVKRGLFAV